MGRVRTCGALNAGDRRERRSDHSHFERTSSPTSGQRQKDAESRQTGGRPGARLCNAGGAFLGVGARETLPLALRCRWSRSSWFSCPTSVMDRCSNSSSSIGEPQMPQLVSRQPPASPPLLHVPVTWSMSACCNKSFSVSNLESLDIGAPASRTALVPERRDPPIPCRLGQPTCLPIRGTISPQTTCLRASRDCRRRAEAIRLGRRWASPNRRSPTSSPRNVLDVPTLAVQLPRSGRGRLLCHGDRRERECQHCPCDGRSHDRASVGLAAVTSRTISQNARGPTAISAAASTKGGV